MPADLDTVIIPSADAERLAAFYAAAFELGEPERGPGHLGLHAGSTYLGIDQIDVGNGGASSVALWFRVDDVDAAFARLVAAGADVIYAPLDKPWGDRLASLRDPDGNRIGLSQRS